MTVKYVVREGYEKGKGRYLGPGPINWVSCSGVAVRYTSVSEAAYDANVVSGRVVPVTTRKVPRKVRVTKEQLEKAIHAQRKAMGLTDPWTELGQDTKDAWFEEVGAGFTALGFEVEEP